MGIGISIVLFGVGAVVTLALEREAEGINLGTVGMSVGGIGPVASMWFWRSWGRYRRVVRERAVTVESADPPAPGRGSGIDVGSQATARRPRDRPAPPLGRGGFFPA
jgi:hypothetical protein